MTTKEIDRRATAARQGQQLDRSDPLALGKAMAASGYFADAKSESQAIVKVVAGMELGIGSLAAMTGIHIIQGKPVIGANVMATLVKRHHDYHYHVTELGNDGCEIIFYQRGPDGWQELGRSRFDKDDAGRAGVTGKDNWKRFPRNMYFARALSNGVGFYCPDIAAGAPVYTPEEMDVVVDEATGEVAADIPPASPPVAVATSGEQPQAEPVEPTEDLITGGQRRMLFAKGKEVELLPDHEDTFRAILKWASGEEHTDRIPKRLVTTVRDAVVDHEATIAAITDRANEGDAGAVAIVDRYLDPSSAGGDDPGPQNGAQTELGA